MRSPGWVSASILALVAATGLSGCTNSVPEQESTVTAPDYTPVPDEELTRQIAAIDGVVEEQVSYEDSTNTPNTYLGRITVADGVTRAEAVEIYDHAVAILRQGRPRAGMGILVESASLGVDSFVVSSADLDLRGGTPDALEKRYGPQPGDGTPPDGG